MHLVITGFKSADSLVTEASRREGPSVKLRGTPVARLQASATMVSAATPLRPFAVHCSSHVQGRLGQPGVSSSGRSVRCDAGSIERG